MTQPPSKPDEEPQKSGNQPSGSDQSGNEPASNQPEPAQTPPAADQPYGAQPPAGVPYQGQPGGQPPTVDNPYQQNPSGQFPPPPGFGQQPPPYGPPPGYPPPEGQPGQPGQPFGPPPMGYPGPGYGLPPQPPTAKPNRVPLIVVGVVVVLALLTVGSWLLFFRGPDTSTPRAAVKEFLKAAQDSDIGKAKAVLCKQIKNSAGRLGPVEGRDGGVDSFTIEDEERKDSANATVTTKVKFSGGPGLTTIVWRVIKEDGGYRVCGSENASPDDLDPGAPNFPTSGNIPTIPGGIPTMPNFPGPGSFPTAPGSFPTGPAFPPGG